MADIIDLANDQAEYLLQMALQRRLTSATTGPSAAFCVDCDDPIPLLRQQKVAGCQTCVPCQGLRERMR